MDDVTTFSRIVESSPAIVVVLLGFLVASWRYFLVREQRMEQREMERDRKFDELTREMVQALRNNTVALENLRHAIEGRR